MFSISTSFNLLSSLQRQLSTGKTESKSFRMMHAKNVSRPQLKFKEKVDNTNTPFVPIIKHKPNAQKPLVKGRLYYTWA